MALLLGSAAQAFDAEPPAPHSVFDALVAATGLRRPGAMPAPRTGSTAFEETGHVILRAGTGPEEIWVHCDCGPLGYLSIAAHGHADALSLEMRVGGVDVLADPGTFLYHADRALAALLPEHAGPQHADGRRPCDQADYGGSFTLAEPCRWRGRGARSLPETGKLAWQARHDGYKRLADPAIHHRRTSLDPAARVIEIADWLDSAGPHEVALAFHLGPDVRLELDGAAAALAWPGGSAAMALPDSLRWSVHRGEESPPLGWYSRHYGQREPITTLIGRGTLAARQQIDDEDRHPCRLSDRSTNSATQRRVLIIVENLPVPVRPARLARSDDAAPATTMW